VSCADVSGDGRADLIFATGTTLHAASADTGQKLWMVDLRAKEDDREEIDNAPLILDADGDGRLDVFVITGRGLSNETQQRNYGRAYMLRAGEGPAGGGSWWSRFRGGPRNLGSCAGWQGSPKEESASHKWIGKRR
jgi:hypothetical protein